MTADWKDIERLEQLIKDLQDQVYRHRSYQDALEVKIDSLENRICELEGKPK
jgi:polyhydroxyalkanoate synthesis regulator phasin